MSIPNVHGQTVKQGYLTLHHSGLRVTISQPFVLDSLLNPSDQIVSLLPRAGRSVSTGSTVALTVGCPGCGLASPAVPTHIPAYRLPNFVGEHVSSVSAWLDHKVLYLTEHVGPLRRGDAATFDDNYRISRQSPRPGSVLRLGIGRRTSRSSGRFAPTPLVIWLTQTRG